MRTIALTKTNLQTRQRGAVSTRELEYNNKVKKQKIKNQMKGIKIFTSTRPGTTLQSSSPRIRLGKFNPSKTTTPDLEPGPVPSLRGSDPPHVELQQALRRRRTLVGFIRALFLGQLGSHRRKRAGGTAIRPINENVPRRMIQSIRVR